MDIRLLLNTIYILAADFLVITSSSRSRDASARDLQQGVREPYHIHSK